MAASGLQELLETVYVGNSVRLTGMSMLSGKAVSRAIRGHSPCGKSL